jgi:hypothetical protein
VAVPVVVSPDSDLSTGEVVTVRATTDGLVTTTPTGDR